MSSTAGATPTNSSSSIRGIALPPPPSPLRSPRTPQSLPGSSMGRPRNRIRSNSLNSNAAALPQLHSPQPPPLLPSLSSGGGLPLLPNFCATKAASAAADAAMQQERNRVRELEKQEVNMDEKELRLALRRERMHSCKLAADLGALKSAAVSSQAEAEACEEGRINGLMRKLESLYKEKGRIVLELEREEEMLTNTLQKKLNEVRREKALLEKQIEREHAAAAHSELAESIQGDKA
eukprot:CAMPEP_0195508402 /NCGR_PEP_ID=MMETSP0794_2-20130614/1614_1 /TAXON_ID=515487 /ORGANISM="Stephanopyxis turris, Strain CCMP 815" /LENGTH=235 /DNA_ID=CAMNT_0040635347 /DNA_START=166 /DNA_END=873 /DNA_ORIENTATION=+